EANNLGLNALHGFMVAFLSEVIPFVLELVMIFFVVSSLLNLIISIPFILIFILYAFVTIIFSKKERISAAHINLAKMKSVSLFYENIVNFDNVKIANSEKHRLK